MVFDGGAVDVFKPHVPQNDAEHVEQIGWAVRYRACQHDNIDRVQQLFGECAAVIPLKGFQLVQRQCEQVGAGVKAV